MSARRWALTAVGMRATRCASGRSGRGEASSWDEDRRVRGQLDAATRCWNAGLTNRSWIDSTADDAAGCTTRAAADWLPEVRDNQS